MGHPLLREFDSFFEQGALESLGRLPAIRSGVENKMTADKKGELLWLVTSKAFDPVMRAKPDGRLQSETDRLEHVQQATRAEIERYRGYKSAEALVTNFKRDLHSAAAKKIHAELRRLGLPTIEDIKDEFEQKARELGVHGGS